MENSSITKYVIKNNSCNGLYFNNKIIKEISGPVSIHILKPKNPELPIFLLFGDVHESYANMCDKKPYSYIIYEKPFIDLFDIKGVDFFIEDHYHNPLETDLHKLLEEEPDDILSELLNISRGCYNRIDKSKCLTKFIRWHFVDSRNVVLKCNHKVLFSYIFGRLLEVIEVIKKEDLDEYYINKIKEYYKEFLIILNKNSSFVDCILNDLLNIKQNEKNKSSCKILDKLKEFYLDKENLLYLEYKKCNNLSSYNYIKCLLIDFFKDFDKKTDDEIFKKIKNFKKKSFLCYILKEISTFSVDIYYILRSFKYTDSKLNIGYFGLSHTINIKDFLIYSNLYENIYEQINSNSKLSLPYEYELFSML